MWYSHENLILIIRECVREIFYLLLRWLQFLPLSYMVKSTPFCPKNVLIFFMVFSGRFLVKIFVADLYEPVDLDELFFIFQILLWKLRSSLIYLLIWMEYLAFGHIEMFAVWYICNWNGLVAGRKQSKSYSHSLVYWDLQISMRFDVCKPSNIYNRTIEVESFCNLVEGRHEVIWWRRRRAEAVMDLWY